MLVITSSYLNKLNNTYAAELSKLSVIGCNKATLATIGFDAEIVTTLPIISGQETDIPIEWESLSYVTANGVQLTPALDPQMPVLGEYVFNPYTKKITVYV
jgi:hypothetical protein